MIGIEKDRDAIPIGQQKQKIFPFSKAPKLVLFNEQWDSSPG
jgi:hypothetical protein